MGQYNYTVSVTANTAKTAPITISFQPNQKHITAVDWCFEVTTGWLAGFRIKDHGKQFLPHQDSPTPWMSGMGGIAYHWDADYDLIGQVGALDVDIDVYNTDASARLVQVLITTQDHPMGLVLRQLLAIIGKAVKQLLGIEITAAGGVEELVHVKPSAEKEKK